MLLLMLQIFHSTAENDCRLYTTAICYAGFKFCRAPRNRSSSNSSAVDIRRFSNLSPTVNDKLWHHKQWEQSFFFIPPARNAGLSPTSMRHQYSRGERAELKWKYKNRLYRKTVLSPFWHDKRIDYHPLFSVTVLHHNSVFFASSRHNSERKVEKRLASFVTEHPFQHSSHFSPKHNFLGMQNLSERASERKGRRNFMKWLTPNEKELFEKNFHTCH